MTPLNNDCSFRLANLFYALFFEREFPLTTKKPLSDKCPTYTKKLMYAKSIPSNEMPLCKGGELEWLVTRGLMMKHAGI